MAARTTESAAAEPETPEAAAMSPVSLQDLEDAVLVRRYEAAKKIASDARRPLLKELERRASRRGCIADTDNHVGYQWDDASESVVRVERDPVVLRAQQQEYTRLRKAGMALGALALNGPARPLSHGNSDHPTNAPSARREDRVTVGRERRQQQQQQPNDGSGRIGVHGQDH